MFNREGQRDPNRTAQRLTELTRHLWTGEQYERGFHEYDGKIPIIATSLPKLREHGPHGPVFLRFGWRTPQQSPPSGSRGPAPRRGQSCLKESRAEQRQVAAEQAARKAAEREAQRPLCTGCGARFTDDRWETASKMDWGTPTDSHPGLCDGCKQWAVADEGRPAGNQEHHEPASRGAEPYEFQRYPRRPVCAECRTPFTDERWKAVERVGWTARQEANASLCEHCDQRHEAGLREAWPDQQRRQEQGPEPEQEQVVPEQKVGRWFSRRT